MTHLHQQVFVKIVGLTIVRNGDQGNKIPTYNAIALPRESRLGPHETSPKLLPGQK